MPFTTSPPRSAQSRLPAGTFRAIVATAGIVCVCACGCSSKTSTSEPPPTEQPPVGVSPEVAKADKDLRQTWEKFRDLLIRDVREADAYEGLIDDPEGMEYLRGCLRDGDDLIVAWLRMRRDDLPRAKANFKFYLDRDECEITFTGIEDTEIPVLLAKRIAGAWVIWPQRG
jgi:hypothetical protein